MVQVKNVTTMLKGELALMLQLLREKILHSICSLQNYTGHCMDRGGGQSNNNNIFADLLLPVT